MGLVVFRGVVIFGYCLMVIMFRILCFIYGIVVGKEFDLVIYREDKKVIIDDKDKCVDCFFIIINVGIEIEIGYKEMVNFLIIFYY